MADRGRRVAAAVRATALAAVVALGLAACTSDEIEIADPSPTQTTQPVPEGTGDSDDGEPSPLLPVFPDGGEPWTIVAAQSETERVADRVAGLVAIAGLLNDDLVSQEVEAATGGTYWGVIHTLTLQPTVDSAGQAGDVVSALEGEGWLVEDVSDTDESYLAALSSGEDADRAWFLVVGADFSVPGQSVVTVQLASPLLSEG
ncbi:hypothetical protein [Marisediminicola sp. LYQ134]|uniref:hypothetical protein n=1 Tax=Marisediminicola sp. LYQ134 TaxID=3391061 RepID=UPI003982F4B7